MEIDLGRGLPEHVAIIMDGNGRWARQQLMPRIMGHRKGAERVREVVNAAGELGVKALTLYAFSEENWLRPRDEVDGLMHLLEIYLEGEVKKLHDNKVRFRAIGNRDMIPPRCRKLIADGENLMRDNEGLNLTIALSYGGRSEIVDTCKKLARAVACGTLNPEDIDQASFAEHLMTFPLPDPDLLIRTSGELRISNFLLWQMAYTEMYFTPVLWPDFGRSNFVEALQTFQGRKRRFGKIDVAEKKSPSVIC